MKKHLLTTLTIVFIFLSCSNDPIKVDTSDVYTIEDVLRADYNFDPDKFRKFFRNSYNLSEKFKDSKFWDDKDGLITFYRIPIRLKEKGKYTRL